MRVVSDLDLEENGRPEMRASSKKCGRIFLRKIGWPVTLSVINRMEHVFFFDEGNDQIDPAEPAISVMDSLDQNRFRLDS